MKMSIQKQIYFKILSTVILSIYKLNQNGRIDIQIEKNQMHRSSTTKRFSFQQFSPHLIRASRTTQVYQRSPLNPCASQPSFFGSDLSKSGISCATNCTSFSRASRASRNSRDFLNDSITGVYSRIDEFKEDFETQVVDRFVKGICKNRLREAKIENVQVLIEDNGDLRYKMLYNEFGMEKEAVVLRTERHTLELVAENTLSGDTVGLSS